MLYVTSAYAIELESPRFKIELKNLDINPKETKETIYNLDSLFGNNAQNDFNTSSFISNQSDLNDELSFDLSPSLINFNQLTSTALITPMEFTANRNNNLGLSVSLIQESPSKSLSGETIGVNYSLNGETKFRRLPSQNAGENQTLIAEGGEKISQKLFFAVDKKAERFEGTYDTVINFIVKPKL